jgi:hypothetical protein
MRKLAIVSAGIVAISGTSLAFALRADTPAGADNSHSQPNPASNQNNSQSDLNVDLDSSSTTSNGTSSNSTTLRVNGEDIEVPENGEIHRKIQSNGQITDISVQSSSSQNGGNNSNSTEVEVEVSD